MLLFVRDEILPLICRTGQAPVATMSLDLEDAMSRAAAVETSAVTWVFLQVNSAEVHSNVVHRGDDTRNCSASL